MNIKAPYITNLLLATVVFELAVLITKRRAVASGDSDGRV